MNKSILVFVQGNQRSVYIESLIFELHKRGHNVVVGSLGCAGDLHEYLHEKGFLCYEFYNDRKPLLSYYYRNYKFWKKIIKTHKINAVFSHLQWANFIALLIGIFSFGRVKVVPTRHHVDASFLHNSRKGKIEDVIINCLAKRQVVVSERAKKFMLQNEFFARQSRIFYVPLGYNFENYNHLQSGRAIDLRKENSCELLFVMISRLIKTKKHLLIIDSIKILKDRGLDVKLMILDNGPEKEKIENKIKLLGLQNHIRMYGYQKYVIDFIKAADIVLQPSLEESSNQVVKEASIYGKTVVVTRHVGDFDEYIDDKVNAFFIEKDTTSIQFADLIQDIYFGKYDTKQMAKNLEFAVRSRFDIARTVNEYLKISNFS